MSASCATTHGLAVRSLSAVARAITSPADATMARFTYPSTQMSARTVCNASTAAAPTATCASLQQPAADEHHLGVRVVRQRRRNRRRVGDEGAVVEQRETAGQLQRRRAAVENDHACAREQRQRTLGECSSLLG